MFCPSCGSTKEPFIKGLCKKCFLKQNKLLSIPEEIKIEHCKFCNKIRLGGRWVEQSEEALKNFLVKKPKLKEFSDVELSVSLEPLDETTIAKVKAVGIVDGNKISVEEETLLGSQETQCDPCMRMRSDYFEAKIQIRFDSPTEKNRKEFLEKIDKQLESLKPKDSLAAIAQVVYHKSGFDVVIGSNRATQKVVRKLAQIALGPVKKSSSLVGRDKAGKEKRRFTYCLRF
jgi:nonsense-mediated mRNA decay protein 3